MNEVFCPSLRCKGLRRQQAKVLAFFVHDPSRTRWLGSISPLSAFVSAVCFRTVYIRLLWGCLYLKKKKNRKASCVFIALAISCRAKRVTSVSSSKQLGKVYSRRPNSRRLTQEPLHRAWLPLCAFNYRRPLLVSIGSNKGRSDSVFTALPPLGPWANAVGLVGRIIRSKTQRGSVAP